MFSITDILELQSLKLFVYIYIYILHYKHGFLLKGDSTNLYLPDSHETSEHLVTM